MLIEGKVESISEVVLVGSGQRQKKSVIVVEQVYEGKYPNSLMIDFMGDKIHHLDQIQAGDMVRVHYSTRCNQSENNGRIYNNIKGYFIELLQTA